MSRFVPQSKFIYDLAIVSGIVLGAMAMLGKFEPRYVCTFGTAPATMNAYFGGFALLAFGIGGMIWQKRQQLKNKVVNSAQETIHE